MNDNVLTKLDAQNIPLFIVTADAIHAPVFKQKNIIVLSCDATVIKTAARVNPTYFVMKGADILAKYSYPNAENIFTYLK